MSDDRADLILEFLSAIRSEIGELKTSMVEEDASLGFLEA